MSAAGRAARPRIFIIGFNRCGTSSLHRFFKRAGYRSLHWDRGRLAMTMERNARAGAPIMAGYEDHEVFSDMFYHCVHVSIHANRYFREIAEQEPDARFILNVRDEDRWVQSLSYWHNTGVFMEPDDHGMPCDPPLCVWEPVRAELRQFGLDTVEQVHDLWRRRWREHIAAVVDELSPERLLVFDIERDDPLALCRFVGLPDRQARHWRAVNPSLHAPWCVRVGRLLPRPVRRRLPERFKVLTILTSWSVEHALRRLLAGSR